MFAFTLTETAQAPPGRILNYLEVHNPTAATVYVKLHDALLGAVTPGTTPPTLDLAIPAGASRIIPLRGADHFRDGIVMYAATGVGASATPPTAPLTGFLAADQA